MKHLILFAAFICAAAAKAQTIDTTTVRPFSVVRIATPFQVFFNDTTKATYLMVESSSDNFKDKVLLNYALFTAPGVSPARRIYNGMLEMTGSEYSVWKTKATVDADRKYIFQFVATKLNVSIQ